MIDKFLNTISQTKSLVLLIFAFMTIFGLIAFQLSRLAQITGGIGILDFEVGYSNDKVMQFFTAYGDEGFAIYQTIQLLDILNPLLYALIFSGFFYRFAIRQNESRDKHSKFALLALLPFLMAFFDYAENITLFLLTKRYPNISESLVTLSSSLSIIKNSVIVITVVTFLCLIVFRKAKV